MTNEEDAFVAVVATPNMFGPHYEAIVALGKIGHANCQACHGLGWVPAATSPTPSSRV